MSEIARRPRVLLLFGGRSGEHEVSCSTAAGILRAIDRERWDVIPVGITQDGQWVPVPDDPARFDFHDGHGARVEAGDRCVALLTGTNELVEYAVGAGLRGARDLGPVDVVFPLLHGPYGEDGTVQGLLEMSGVRYVGCGVAASAASMDKYLTKRILQGAGIPVGRWELVTPREWREHPDAVLERLERLGFPQFVKPTRAGSSLGISRVAEPSALPAAIKEAQNTDPRVLVEAALTGQEVECGVLAGPGGAAPRTAPVGEIDVTEQGRFYDYAAKYTDPDAAHVRFPADIPEALARRVRELSLAAFEALECEGLARIDFFVDADAGRVVLNEVNTMPGFTPISMYPIVWRKAGLSYSELVSELLESALERPLGLR